MSWEKQEEPIIEMGKDVGGSLPDSHITLVTDGDRHGSGEWLRMFERQNSFSEPEVRAGMYLRDWVHLAHAILAYDIAQRTTKLEKLND